MDLQQLKNLVIFHATHEHEAGCDPIQFENIQDEGSALIFEKATILLNSLSTIEEFKDDYELVSKIKHQAKSIQRPLYWV